MSSISNLKTSSHILLLLALCLSLFSCQEQSSETSTEPAEKRVKLRISTNFGDMDFELFNETPLHRDNFLERINQGFYKESSFYFVQRNNMIIGGAPKSDIGESEELRGMINPSEKVEPEIREEFLPLYGMLCAYHFGPELNPSLESLATQFFIIHGRELKDYQLDEFAQKRGRPYSPEERASYTRFGGLPAIEGQYTIFGRIVAGTETLDEIVKLPTRAQPFGQTEEDVILSISLLE